MRQSSHAGLGLLALIATAVMGLGPTTADAAEEEERRVLSADDYDAANSGSAEYRRLAQEARLESIRRLKELISQGVSGDRKAEMMLRLADLYFQQGREIQLQEMEDFEIAFDDCFNDDSCDTKEMQPDNAESHDWQRKSIKLYDNILRNYPRYARADQATYYKGVAHAALGEQDDALESYKKLVKLYPQSGFVPDAFVLIGEHYFADNNAYAALRAFLKAATFKESERYAFAMYKLAWCYYNVGEYGKGIDTMKTVVAYSMENDDQSSGLKLHEEALRDLVRFFADAGEMDEAYEYFTKLGKKDLIKSMLRRLADLYFEQGKYEQSVETFRRLILEDPTSSKNAGYQHEIIKAYGKMGQKDRVLEEIDRLRNEYGSDSSWARNNATDQDAVNEAMDVIEKVLRKTATDYHTEAQTLAKSKHRRAGEAYDRAYQAYMIYLGDFPSNDHTYEVRYAFGELLWDTKKFDEAFEQYMKVVEIDPKGKHSRFCAESAIFAAEEMVKKEGGLQTRTIKPEDIGDPEPLTEWETRLITSSRQYAQLFEDDQKLRGIIYKSAYLLYNKFHFSDAAALFRDVIKMDPGSRDAETAAHLMLDVFNVKNDWGELKENAKFYYDQEGLGSSTFKKEMFEIYQRSSFKLIETNLETSEDFGTAADAFVAFYEEFPDADVSGQALNNASVYYHKVNRVADAMRIRHILIEDQKFGEETKYYYDQVGSLGFDYERIADFDTAATWYERFFGLYPEEREKLEKTKGKDAPANKDELLAAMDQRASDAIYTAAVFRNALGQWQKSIDNYQTFIGAFPADSRTTETEITIGRIYEENGASKDAGNAFYAFYTKNKEAPADFIYFTRLHHGRALIEGGERAKAERLYGDTVAMYETLVADGKDPGAIREIAAEMMNVLAEESLDKYLKLEIKNSGQTRSKQKEDKVMKDSLSAKTTALVALEATYISIVETGAGEWGIAALIAVGQAYEDMGGSLVDAPLPYYLTEDQAEMYTMAIEDRVYVQEEKAVAAYKLALEKSFELTLYNENTAFAARRLGELRPNEFPGLEESLLKPGYVSKPARAFTVESEIR